MKDQTGRGSVAVADMKARLAAGWTFDQLWDRMTVAESGAGYVYDYAERVDSAPVESHQADGSHPALV